MNVHLSRLLDLTLLKPANLHPLLCTAPRYRADLPVRDSKGALRPESVGAATRRLFSRLHFVGPAVAQQWWNAGYRWVGATMRRAQRVPSAACAERSVRQAVLSLPGLPCMLDGLADSLDDLRCCCVCVPRSFEDVERARDAGTLPKPLSTVQDFGLRHRVDFLEGTSGADLDEMEAAVRAALEAVSGVQGGWHVELVGGSRRQQRPGEQRQAEMQQQPQQQQQSAQEQQPPQSQPQQQPQLQPQQRQQQHFHHDADFMCSHSTYEWGRDLIEAVRDELLRRGRLVPVHRGAALMVQRGRLEGMEDKLLEELAGLRRVAAAAAAAGQGAAGEGDVEDDEAAAAGQLPQKPNGKRTSSIAGDR